MTASTMEVDYDVAMEVASHEALIRQAYRDSVGVLTWCVGLTSATGHKVDRYIGKPASLFQCMSIYVWALNNYAIGVRRAFKGHTLTKAQFAAAMSFHWNTGAIERALWVQLWKQGKIAEAKAAFMLWDKPAAIIGRRKKERDLFFDGKWSNNGTMTEYTKVNKNLTPVWSSAVKINVREELQRAFGAQMTVQPDVPPQPEAPMEVPTLSPADPVGAPAQTTTAAKAPLWLIVGAILLAVAGVLFAMFSGGPNVG